MEERRRRQPTKTFGRDLNHLFLKFCGEFLGFLVIVKIKLNVHNLIIRGYKK